MWVVVEQNSQITLARQIYQQVRQMILQGTIDAGYQLPSTRKLAADLAVSRNTVIEAYSQLIAEGYLESRQGSGTVVAAGLYAIDIKTAGQSAAVCRPKTEVTAAQIIDFRTGIPALKYFPRKEWTSFYRDICNELPDSRFGYCSAFGVWELREAIARYLYRTRGLTCAPEHIMITSGSTQGLSLLSHLLGTKDKPVLIEDPTHAGLRKVITMAGCSVKGISVDHNGLRTDLLSAQSPVAFIYTTPSHQYPTGSILPAKRRLELVRYARQHNCYLIEDDYDSEFRFEGQPVSPLYDLDPEHVIYLGSFSKVLAPALRIGFAILPPRLIDACKKLKAHTDVHSDTLNQYVLARFIETGRFERHIWKMKKLYAKNRITLINELTRYFPSRFTVLGHATGLHLVVRFSNQVITQADIAAIADSGVRIYQVDNFYFDHKDGSHSGEILLGYSHLSPEEISTGIKIISEYFRVRD